MTQSEVDMVQIVFQRRIVHPESRGLLVFKEHRQAQQFFTGLHEFALTLNCIFDRRRLTIHFQNDSKQYVDYANNPHKFAGTDFLDIGFVDAHTMHSNDIEYFKFRVRSTIRDVKSFVFYF